MIARRPRSPARAELAEANGKSEALLVGKAA